MKHQIQFYLPVLKSDNANGLFGFKDQCSPIHASTEDRAFTCRVMRGRGDAGSVTLTWEIRLKDKDQPALHDFSNHTGQLLFIPGEREKVNMSTCLSAKICSNPFMLNPYAADV